MSLRTLLLAIATTACLAAPPAGAATWTHGKLCAVDRSYRTVPASELSSPLAYLTPVRCGDEEGTVWPAICSAMEDRGTSFSVEGDFNGDGKPELAEAIVARGATGTQFTGLIISDLDNPRKNQILLIPGDGFSALSKNETGFAWHVCARCANPAPLPIVWKPELQEYRPDFSE